MEILPVSLRIREYLRDHQIERVFQKQLNLLLLNPFHPSLRTEVLEPKHLKFYSFRITRSYRAIFIYRAPGSVEIIDVNNHYR